jgi:hypothetical protein
MIDRRVFFDAVRARPFGGKLAQSQVDGLEVILSTYERDYRDGASLAQLAYVLATAFHETARTMQPIKEYGGAAYLANNYDVTGRNPERARRMGNDRPGDGIKYAGRGYVQLTWKNNYRTMGQLLGVDLVAFPDRAMEPVLAARIMFEGMIHGLFTGQKLADHINPRTTNFVGARGTVNGTDQARKIADYAVDFFGALKAAERPSIPHVPKPSPQPAPPAPPVKDSLTTEPPASGGWLAKFLAALAAAFRSK